MSNLFSGGVLRSPDASDGGGTDPFRGAGAPAEAPLGEGTDPFRGPGAPENLPEAEGTNPMGALAQPAKPAAAPPSAPAAQQGGMVHIAEEDAQLIGARYSTAEQEAMIARFGAGAVDYMLQQASEYIGSQFASGDAVQQPQQPAAPKPQTRAAAADPLADDDDAGDDDDAPARSAAASTVEDPLSFTPARDALREMRDVVGDKSYKEVIRPLLRQTAAQANEIKALRDHVVATVNGMNGHLSNQAMDRLNIKDLGNSEDNLSAHQENMRRLTYAGAQQIRLADPSVSIRKAVLAGYQHAKKVAGKQNGAQPNPPAPQGRQPAQQPNRGPAFVGSVPQRSYGPAQRTAATAQPMSPIEVAQRHLDAMRAAGT